jgi:hypothetical protein
VRYFPLIPTCFLTLCLSRPQGIRVLAPARHVGLMSMTCRSWFLRLSQTNVPWVLLRLNFMRKFKCLFSTCGDFDVWAEMVVGLQSFVHEGNLIIRVLWCRLISRTRGAAFFLVSFRGIQPHMPTTPGSRIHARTIRPWTLSGIHQFLPQLFFLFFLPLIQLIWM